MNVSPFRTCDYCGSEDDPSKQKRGKQRRAWTLFSHSRKLACPSCTSKGSEENERTLVVLNRYRTLLEYRLLAEPGGDGPQRRGDAEGECLGSDGNADGADGRRCALATARGECLGSDGMRAADFADGADGLATARGECHAYRQAGLGGDGMAPTMFTENGQMPGRVLQQYGRIKGEYPDAVLMFRAGDHYYLLEGDAEVGAAVLGLTTGLIWCGEQMVRLASFPFSALDSYLPKVVKAGYRVAICDQLEGPPVAGMVCEPPMDAPLRKTHRIALRGNASEVDVHKSDGQYYGLDGSWSIATDDRRIRSVVLRYSVPITAPEDGSEQLQVVYEPVEEYRRIKPLYKDALLVLRDHQGYLMLYRDAQRAAEVLQVGYNGTGAFRIAKSMLETVLDQLVKAGHRVAVVIDPHVDDPRMARQTDLWDALATEATLVGEPGEDGPQRRGDAKGECLGSDGNADGEDGRRCALATARGEYLGGDGMVGEPTADYGEWARRYTRAELDAEVAATKERIADLETRGDAACSAYDLRLGYDARFNLEVMRNRLIYYEKLLAAHPSTLAPTLF